MFVTPCREGVLVRVHSECLTGDVFGSLRPPRARLPATAGLIVRTGREADGYPFVIQAK
ncbi:MAG: hypothetical protein ACLP01_10430 [Solirubrobacteraceae bacterium]